MTKAGVAKAFAERFERIDRQRKRLVEANQDRDAELLASACAEIALLAKDVVGEKVWVREWGDVRSRYSEIEKGAKETNRAKWGEMPEAMLRKTKGGD